MTEYIVRRTGKMLFPHLARDQRNWQMLQILVVLTVTVMAITCLVMWMSDYRH